MESLGIEEIFDVAKHARPGIFQLKTVSWLAQSCLRDKKNRSMAALSEQQPLPLLERPVFIAMLMSRTCFSGHFSHPGRYVKLLS